MLLQLNPPIPLYTPRGFAEAVLVIDYGPDYDLCWVCFLAASLFGALGQFLYKSGAERATAGWQSYLFNPRLLGGVVCYCAVMVLFVAAFKRATRNNKMVAK